MHVDDAHTLCDDIEEEIKDSLANVKVTIHVEPRGYHEGNIE